MEEAIAATDLRQGGHPFVAESSCLEKYAITLVRGPSVWARTPRAIPFLSVHRSRRACSNLVRPMLRRGN